MAEFESRNCPECIEAFDFPAPPPVQPTPAPAVDRRDFIRVLGVGAAAATLATPLLAAPSTAAKKDGLAEELIKELFADLKDDQKAKVVLPYDHGTKGGKGLPTRQRMVNAPLQNIRIDSVYTKPQIDLLTKIVKAMSSGDEGYRQLSRGGTWDNSKSFERCGALIFGDPTKGQFAFTLTGHHLTARIDSDLKDGIAFGGPIYYGHTPRGYSAGNVFFYQTKSVMGVFDALDAKQQKLAMVKGDSGEHERSVRFRKKEERPGLPISELSKDQKELVWKVMRTVLSPYRKEDADEVMEVIKKTGGLEKIQLAFYTEGGDVKPGEWSYWRLEGPGFVWNYRVLPHVHTYVNISSKLAS